ncbi:MAG: flagellin lysine-N-methylase [Gammaproteobacteria bacterium]|nr:flagellin lysine-N-methylase [Gammaproteobacteria bacterium]
MPVKYKTPASFSGFSCLGAQCEDTCCQNWEVKIDQQHYELLKNVMSADKDEQNIFEKRIYLNTRPVVSEHDYAFVRMADTGFCSMLDDEGLCYVHAKYGEKLLGNVCTMFPRVISRTADSVELSAALSCPEVVRRCIDDTELLKFNRFKPTELPGGKNYPVLRELSQQDDDFYSGNFVYVRENFMLTMANEEQELETRLYTLVNMANKLSEFYHRGCAKPGQGQIESVMATYAEPEFVTRLGTFIKSYDAGSLLNMIVVHSVLSIKLQQAGAEKISVLYEKIIQYYNDETKSIPEILADKITSIRNSLDSDAQQYVDKAITRYSLNCLYREWFVSMPDPFTYVQMLLLRLSILRTLIYLEAGTEQDMTLDKLKKKIVYIMYNFARNIDQNLEFLKVVYDALSEQTMMNIDFSAVFIRID